MSSIIFTTTNKLAEGMRISHILLNKKLAACVKLFENVRSFYWWKGKIESANEIQLMIITQKNLVEKVFSEIKKIHSYEVPEMIEIQIGRINKDYLDWISKV